MEYQNPKIPEGINVSDEHPLKGFLYLLTAVISVTAIIIFVVSFSVGVLVTFIPFETEVELAARIASSIEATNKTADVNSSAHLRQQQITEYLQSLAGKLSLAQQLPEKMYVKIHYIDEPVINAFATVGGHIIIYQGLIDALASENALSMVLAHEIAHIKHRHPIIALGRGASITLLFSAITGFGDNGFINSAVSQVSLFTALAFSRSQETVSDMEAYNTLVKHYGHGRGATDLFFILNEQKRALAPPELLSSHPLSEKRIEKLKVLARQSASGCTNDVKTCSLEPLPEFIKSQRSQ